MSNLSLCLHAFVTQLLNGGVKHVVINPGSRNFPLIKTFVNANKFVQLHSCVDERSAGFMALGLAQSSKSPVVLCCTSGTAGLNYYPAIAEALYSETPLIVLTADRPPESIDNWEGQCIRQQNVFAQHTCFSVQTPSNIDNTNKFSSIAQQCVAEAMQQNGPVHVNMPFHEPFYTNWESKDFDVQPTAHAKEVFVDVPGAMTSDIQKSTRILWINGADNSQERYIYPDQLVVFSDVISNKPKGITNWENLFLTEVINHSELLPDLLITTGKYVVSKKLRTFLKKADNLVHWHISEQKEIPTPFHTQPHVIHCNVNSVLDQISNAYTSYDYKQRFSVLDKKLNHAIQEVSWESDAEYSIIQKIYSSLPENAVLHMSNSMPVRYIGLMPRREDIIHQANRGTSGIDGCTSTAVGYAKATEKPVFLITGDLAFLYDINGLWLDEIPPNLKIVVLNNHGGGIFELIEGPNTHQDSLAFQTTDHNLNMNHMAKHFGIDYLNASSFSEVQKCLDAFLSTTKPVILEVQTQRSVNNAFFETYKKGLQLVTHDNK